MQIIKSGFADVCVITTQERTKANRGLKETFCLDPVKLLNEEFPPFICDADMIFEQKNELTAMCYQRPDDQYTQLVRCTYGEVYVGILDIRPDSKDYKKSKLFFISADNGKGVCIPRGFAVAYMSNTEHAAITVKMDRRHEPERELFMSPFDPVLTFKWPAERVVVSVKDRYAPGFAEVERLFSEDLMKQLYIDPQTLEIEKEERVAAASGVTVTEGMGQKV